MKPDEMQKLLGGYATGTLTAQEQEALFAAALEDQELFDALAKEQALRDLLRDPAARAHVLASMDERRVPWWRAHRWTLAGATAACCLAIAVGIYGTRSKPAAPRPVLVAETRAPEVPPPPAPDVVAQSKRELATPVAPRRRALKSLPAATPAAPAAVLDKDGAAVASTAAPKALMAEVPQDARAAAPQNAPTAVPPAAPLPQFRQAAPSNLAGVPPAETRAALEAQELANALAAGSAGENARSLFYGGQASAFSAGQQVQFARARTGNASLHLGVKWTALRRQADGLFSEVDPADLKAGDTVKLRLVPNDGGYLSVMEGHRAVVAERRVEPLQPFETPELTSAGGSKELVVVLGRQPQQLEKAKAGAGPRIIRTADQSEHAVYEVAAGGSILQPVTVKINLKFQ